MDKKIQFLDVGVSVKNQLIFEHFDFTFHEGKSVCLIGSEGCGKSTLLSAVQGICSFHGDILKDALVRVVLRPISANCTISDYFHFSTLSLEQQMFVQEFLHLSTFDYPILKLNPVFLIKISILEAILSHPAFLFIDDILGDFSMQEKKDLFSFLHRKHITVFYVTSNMEDTLLFSYLVVMGKKGICMEGPTLSVLQEEKIMKRLGFSLPFYVDLSLQLRSYGLISNIYADEKELVSHLWKSN